MSDIIFKNENELISGIKKSKSYANFCQKLLLDKIEREAKAWDLLKNNLGKFSKEILNEILNTVDYYAPNKRWFGQLLATPNRNLIFESDISKLNRCISDLITTEDKSIALNNFQREKIKGASKGIATLIFYLSNPQQYNIWVNKTLEGLLLLNQIQDIKGLKWGEKYKIFNDSVNKFKEKFNFKPEEVDWILTYIAGYVESDDSGYKLSEDILADPEIQVEVDDESELEDLVGEPMELGVMRWTPTNEMGVVALFIEYRKELGFPLVEIIRVRFPDAAVFESSSRGYIRRYIEFEFKSSGYKAHLKSKRKCDYVICWQHDWKDCPIKVIELKTEIPKILNKHS